MRKLYTFALAAALAAGVSAARAEVISNYTCDFNDAISVNEKTHNLPKGWDHIANGAWDSSEYETVYPTYSYVATGGVDGSGAIKCASQAGGWDIDATYDLLVTPPVKGEISIQVNKIYDSSLVEFYLVTKNSSGKLTRGTKLTTTGELTKGEYGTLTATVEGDDFQMIGVRVSSATVDNFVAAQADIEDKRALTIDNTTYEEGTYTKVTRIITTPYDPMYCDEDGYFRLETKVLLRNDGDVDILPGDQDASLTFLFDNKDVYTYPLPEAVEAKTSKAFTVTVPISFEGNNTRSAYEVRENVANSLVRLGWVEPKAYGPELRFRDTADANIDASKGINFGRSNESVSKTYRICNVGPAAMNVLGIDLPDGVSVQPEAPFTVAPSSYQEITLTMNSTMNGNMTIRFEKLNDYVIALSGIRLESDKYFVDFENQEVLGDKYFPEGMLVGANWSVTEWGQGSNKNICYYGLNDTNKHDWLATPLLRFEEGEPFTLDVFRNNYSSEVKVAYSTDRVNWTELTTVSASDMTSTTESDYPRKVKATPVAVNLPAGEYYIGFDANYCYIDHLYGGKKVDVERDLFITNTATPASAMVNYDYVASGKVTNLFNSEANVTVSLLINGEEVASQEVMIAEKPGIKNSTSDGSEAFSLSYMPSEAMEDAVAMFLITDGEYSVKSAQWTLTVAPEEMKSEVVTPYETVKTANTAPLHSNWYKANARVLYTPEYMPLKAGEKINAITFYGYNNSTRPSTDVSIWVANTSETTATASTPVLADMTCVAASKTVMHEQVGSSADNNYGFFTIAFDEPFEYTGESLDVYFYFNSSACNAGMYFLLINDDSAKNLMYSRYADDDSQLQSKGFAAFQLPVTGFSYEAEVPVLSGVVSNEAGDVLEGVAVTIAAVDPQAATFFEMPRQNVVTYSATTDENGAFSIPVMQSGHTYSLSASKLQYVDYAHPENIDMTQGDKALNFVMKVDPATGVDSILKDANRSGIFNMNGVRIHTERENLLPGIYIIDGRKVVVTRK